MCEERECTERAERERGERKANSKKDRISKLFYATYLVLREVCLIRNIMDVGSACDELLSKEFTTESRRPLSEVWQ